MSYSMWQWVSLVAESRPDLGPTPAVMECRACCTLISFSAVLDIVMGDRVWLSEDKDAMGEGSYGSRVIQLSPRHSLACSEMVISSTVRKIKRAQGQAWISKAGYALPLALSTSPMIPINLEVCLSFVTRAWCKARPKACLDRTEGEKTSNLLNHSQPLSLPKTERKGSGYVPSVVVRGICPSWNWHDCSIYLWPSSACFLHAIMLFSANDYYFPNPSQLHLAPEATRRSQRMKRGVNGGLFLPCCLVIQGNMKSVIQECGHYGPIQCPEPLRLKK